MVGLFEDSPTPQRAFRSPWRAFRDELLLRLTPGDSAPWAAVALNRRFSQQGGPQESYQEGVFACLLS